MPSPSSSSTSLSATSLTSTKPPSSYRQTDYYDGRGFRTFESRRRLPTLASMKSPQPVHGLASTPMISPATASSESYDFASGVAELRSSSSSRRPNLQRHDHVTPRSSKSKVHVVIVQGSTSPKRNNQDTMPQRPLVDVSTPPQTPKIGRLPTPDLDDLDERPFCDCCSRVQAVKYCAGCRCELGR